jgi:hypothetical protein
MKNKTQKVAPKKPLNKGDVTRSKNKPTVEQIMMSYRIQLYQIIIYNLHSKFLATDKQYFKDYCKKTGIPERKLRMIINGTYDGTIPDLLALVRRAGLVVDIKYEKC